MQIPTFDDTENIFYAKQGEHDLPKLAYQIEHAIKSIFVVLATGSSRSKVEDTHFKFNYTSDLFKH